MGAHGHEPPYKVPHYSSFTTKGIPELETLQAALERKGLKDPWIRNEAWRYNPGFGTKLQRAKMTFFRGFSIGLALTIFTVTFDRLTSAGGDDHGHGHH